MTLYIFRGTSPSSGVQRELRERYIFYIFFTLLKYVSPWTYIFNCANIFFSCKNNFLIFSKNNCWLIQSTLLLNHPKEFLEKNYYLYIKKKVIYYAIGFSLFLQPSNRSDKLKLNKEFVKQTLSLSLLAWLSWFLFRGGFLPFPFSRVFSFKTNGGRFEI